MCVATPNLPWRKRAVDSCRRFTNISMKPASGMFQKSPMPKRLTPPVAVRFKRGLWANFSVSKTFSTKRDEVPSESSPLSTICGIGVQRRRSFSCDVFKAIGCVELYHHDLTLPPALDCFRRNSEGGGMLAEQQSGHGSRIVGAAQLLAPDKSPESQPKKPAAD
jgi:hypothetical protein